MNSNNFGHSVLTSKSNNDNLIAQSTNRSHRIGTKYITQNQDKISIQLEYMRLQEQYKREITVWQEQTNQFRMQIQQLQAQIHEIQNRQILQKQELNNMHKQNLKLFQQNQKNKKLINTLKSDNKSLQLEIQRWKGDRKTYSAKLDSIYQLKRNINNQLCQKNSLIEQQQSKLRQAQKKLTDYKLKTEQLSANLSEKQRENKDLTTEVRTHLQSFLETQNHLSNMQHDIHQTNELNHSLREKILQLEKEKQILLQRIYNLGGDNTDRSDDNHDGNDYEDNLYFNSNPKNIKKLRNQSPELEHIITPADERLMLEIQSFMREFQNLLNKKAEEKQVGLDHIQKIVRSVECLQKTI